MGDKQCNFCDKSFDGECTDGVMQGRRSEGHPGSWSTSRSHCIYECAALPREPNNGNLTWVIRPPQATIGMGDLSYRYAMP